MRVAYSVAEIRRAEGVAMAEVGDELMQRAAAGLAAVCLGELRRRRGRAYAAKVLLLVGPGNNGGDGLYAGVRLLRRGVQVTALRVMGKAHEAGWAAFLAAGGREFANAPAPTGVGAVGGPPGESGNVGLAGELAGFDLAVDAILGIGGRSGLSGPAAALAEAVAQAGVPVVACDLPSGVPADADAPASSHFQADVTATFGGLKPCHLVEPHRSACGRTALFDIGLPAMESALRQWEPEDVWARWPVPGPTDHKYTRGVVGIDAGSGRYPGARLLAVAGAVFAGAGMVRVPPTAADAQPPGTVSPGVAAGEVSGPEAGADDALGAGQPSNAWPGGGPPDCHGHPGDPIPALFPNVVPAGGQVQARVLGPGWGDRPDGREAVERALSEGVPLVIDADGLRFLPPFVGRGDVLLTPHAGELARLLQTSRAEVEASPAAHVRRAAEQFGATILLKGATQFATTPDGRVQMAVPGPAWTAQGGSGDVLSGVCGTLLATGLPAADAAVMAASLQAMTAAAHLGPLPPQTLASHFPETIAQGVGRQPARPNCGALAR
ncbi:MAG: bifunctional ADP-dependent NAD(P)H-hydrate dehydratase/NAD(P)H-hydrate epimerase [Propionibacteriaceae bacterium]|jgi:hydroxyethylthiazole kinase-like uncharacterized protein yjeF|nr:bifunctional ADP-dependent NAD(P)H-hydrate dehydratase/NAD(P)H-hydrate epimerase [Propionibacteriaceae bacterium]